MGDLLPHSTTASATMEGIAYTPEATQGYILCADCGTPIPPNSANRCVNCLKNSVDITESIPKQSGISFCRNCSRWLSPPQAWLIAELESRELLAICLRKLKGLKEVRLVDAGFVWTEPHSKRLRVKLTVQKEVFSSTVLQQVFEIEFIVTYTQCPDCTRLAAKNTWRAIVQVRQKVDHKRTFLYLEQLILKHGADKDTVSVSERKDGLDFFYASKQHALKMCDFLTAVAPVRMKTSEQLISLDTQNSTTNYKSTYSVEIIPICKDDLVCLPRKLSQSMSSISQLCVCIRVGNSIHVLDPTNLQVSELSSSVYWRTPFMPLTTIVNATEYVVLDIEPTQHPPVTANKGKFLLADAQVTPVNGTMDNDTIYHTRTHLGSVLKPGDTVLGYQLTTANFNDPNWESLNTDRVPQVVLVRKTYPARRKKGASGSAKKRNWRLKSMAKEAGDDNVGFGRDRADPAAKKGGRGTAPGTAADQARAEAEYEMFLRDLEEDEEMRANIMLFKADKNKTKDGHAAGQDDDAMSVAETNYSDDEDGFPKIDAGELLTEEMANLSMAEQQQP